MTVQNIFPTRAWFALQCHSDPNPYAESESESALPEGVVGVLGEGAGFGMSSVGARAGRADTGRDGVKSRSFLVFLFLIGPNLGGGMDFDSLS